MKNWIISFAIVILTISNGYTQQQCKMHRKEIKAQRIAYITQALNLDIEEAQKFWPVYNQYNNALEKLRTNNHQLIANLKQEESKEYYEKYLNQQLINFDKEALLKKDYQKALLKVLSAKKIVLLYRTEIKFKRKMVRELGKKR